MDRRSGLPSVPSRDRDAGAVATCKDCGETKPISQFYVRKGRPRSRCRYCYLAEGKRRREADPDKYREVARRSMRKQRSADPEKNWRQNLKKYGLTPEAYTEMLEAQGGVCAICKEPPKGKRLSVDHDHSCCSHSQYTKPLCGKCNRGLLCQPCNIFIGLAEERIETMKNAITYLERAAR